MADKHTFRIKATNIGPLKGLFKSHNFRRSGYNRSCIFANNGSGKTMLCKTISLINMSETDRVPYYTHLIRKGSTKFDFEFGFYKSNENQQLLKINGDRGSIETIENNTGYIFHVFNEDYIKNNIRAKKYRYDSNIEGYVVGDVTINIDEQNNQLEILKSNQIAIIKKINQSIDEGLKMLEKFDVKSNTNEYKEINFENIKNKNYINKTEDIAELKADHNKLKSLPDDVKLEYIKLINLSLNFEEIKSVLEEKFSISLFSKEFRDKINEKYNFIRQGVNIKKIISVHFVSNALIRKL